MAASDVAICNSALLRVGAASIAALSDVSVEAEACNKIYTQIKNKMLRIHPWKFAKVKVTLTVDATAPDHDWDYRYALPAACLRVVKMEGQEFGYEWTVEGGYLLNNVGGDIGITYISNATAVTAFDSTFDDALIAELAYNLSYSLVQSVTLRKELKEEAKEALRAARAFNGQEGSGDRVYADSWLNSRA
jgi:hypothetical protein